MVKMTFEEYSKKANTTAIYPDRGQNMYYPVLKLCGEAGEVAEKLGKIIRDENSIIDNDSREAF